MEESMEKPEVIPSTNRSANTFLVVLLSVLVTSVVLVGGYFYYTKVFNKVGNEKAETPVEEVVETTEAVETSETLDNVDSLGTAPVANPDITEKKMRTYTNSKYRFKFIYPDNYRVEDAKFKYEPYYPFEEGDMVLNLEVTRDVYKFMAQNPLIRVVVFETDKSVSDFMGGLDASIADNIASMNDPQDIYYGMNVPKPEIFNKKDTTVAGEPAIEVDRFGGPGAPNVDYLEYYFKHDEYVYLLKVNWSRNSTDPNENGSIEFADFEKLVESFEFY